ncbi:MAG: methyl-accepting chemotaxis protein [Defluviitaleaceae bacterium]|nr:methyl-accepting chemotaxis protein [Defluviitaleaceae bacterium]
MRYDQFGTGKRRDMKLAWKLVLSILVISVFSVIISFAIANTVVRNAVYDDIVSGVQNEVHVYSTELDAWFLQSMVAISSFAATMEALGPEHLFSVAGAFQDEFDFIEVAYIAFNADGSILSGDFWVPDDDYIVWQRDWFIAALAAGGAPVFTQPYIDATFDDNLIITLAKYIPNIDAVVAFDMNLYYINELLNRVQLPANGYLFLLDSDGYILAHPDQNLNPRIGMDFVSVYNVPQYAAIIRTGDSVARFTDINGVDSYIMAFDLPSTNWLLVSVLPEIVISAPIWQILTMFVASMVIILFIVCSFMLFTVSRLIISTIKIKIKRFHDVSLALARAEILPERVERDDSFGLGMLEKELDNIVDDISNVHKAVMRMLDEHFVGNFNYSVDLDKHDGIYKEILLHINAMAERDKMVRQTVLSYLQKIIDGDFNAEREYKFSGEEEFINGILENMKTSIMSIAHAITEITAAAQKGDVDYMVDLASYKGEWAKLIKDMNNILSNIKTPIAEMRTVLDHFNAGNLDTRVKGEYTGIFADIKRDINQLTASLGQYVKEIVACLETISGGNLTYRTSQKFSGDFDEINVAINNVAETLQKALTNIIHSSGKIWTGATNISQNSTSLANVATEQVLSVAELAQQLEEVNKQTSTNTENAKKANTISNESTQNATDGNDSMKELLSAMTKIKESSNNISSIIKVIQDIAFQTNLLALNASVEAARAGEYGRGFSVVAEEVGSLAMQSQTAAIETTGLIEDSLSSIEMGNNIANATSIALDQMVASAHNVLVAINNISVSSKEQADSIFQISAGLDKITSTVKDNQTVLEETTRTAHDLNQQADMLKEFVAYFKI